MLGTSFALEMSRVGGGIVKKLVATIFILLVGSFSACGSGMPDIESSPSQVLQVQKPTISPWIAEGFVSVSPKTASENFTLDGSFSVMASQLTMSSETISWHSPDFHVSKGEQ